MDVSLTTSAQDSHDLSPHPSSQNDECPFVSPAPRSSLSSPLSSSSPLPSSSLSSSSLSSSSPLSSSSLSSSSPLSSSSLSSSSSSTPSSSCTGEASRAKGDLTAKAEDLEHAPVLLVLVLSEELCSGDGAGRERETAAGRAAEQGEAQRTGDATEAESEAIGKDGEPEQAFHFSEPPAHRFLRDLLHRLGTPLEERREKPRSGHSSSTFIESPFQGVIMQTKYYDAPVRVVCQCLSRGASPPRCFADRDAVSSVSCKGRGPLKDGQQRALFHASGATPSTLSQPSSPSSLSSVSPSSSSLPASVSSPTSAFAFLRASTITSPQAVFEPAVELAAPPEALLVLCTSLLAAELTGRSEKKRQPDAREHTQAAWPSEVRLEEDETAELPLPGCLRLPPFRLNAPAGDAGKGRGTRETPADGSRDAASACPRADFYTPLGDETDSEEATDGEWLSRVPVKLFAAVEAPEGDSRRCLQSASRVCKRGAWLPDEEDPSEILFFENNCLFERVCVPWPRPSSSLSSCEKQSIAASGPPSGLPPRPVSSSVSSASSSVSSASSASPSFRHSATAHPSLLGSHDAMARLVDALHCHLWPNLKRRAPTKPIAELKKSPAGFSAFRMAPSPSCGVAGLGHAKQASGEKTVEISEPMQCENGEVCRHRLKSGLGDGEARKEAVEEAHEGERGVEEERDQTQSRTGRRSGGNAAEEGHRDREKDGTSSVEVKAASDGKRESERSGFHAEKGVEAASCDVTAAGEAKTGRMGNARKAPGGTSREKESEATDVAHLDSLDAMIKQLRAARVESQNLPFEERRARAEAMALRLASMIGLSEDEDD